jgi:ribosomal protein S18 acetylase RimI-like enzyme
VATATIWDFYVDRPYRGNGIGRALMEHALQHGRERGAVTAWLETSNLNAPGVAVYRKLGFRICGFDLSLYRSTRSEDQFALFLERRLDDA